MTDIEYSNTKGNSQRMPVIESRAGHLTFPNLQDTGTVKTLQAGLRHLPPHFGSTSQGKKKEIQSLIDFLVRFQGGSEDFIPPLCGHDPNTIHPFPADIDEIQGTISQVAARKAIDYWLARNEDRFQPGQEIDHASGVFIEDSGVLLGENPEIACMTKKFSREAFIALAALKGHEVDMTTSFGVILPRKSTGDPMLYLSHGSVPMRVNEAVQEVSGDVFGFNADVRFSRTKITQESAPDFHRGIPPYFLTQTFHQLASSREDRLPFLLRNSRGIAFLNLLRMLSQRTDIEQ